MFDTLKARNSPTAKCNAQILRFERQEKNTVSDRYIMPGSPCSSCSARSKAICAGLSDDEMDGFSRNIRTRLIKAGNSIYREFEKANYFYTVVSGEIRLANLLGDGRRQLTAFKSAGDLLGEHNGGIYQSDAEAVCDAVVCQIPIKILEKYTNEVPAMRVTLNTKMQNELCDLRHHAILLGRKTPIEKIATFLTARSENCEWSDDDKAEVVLTMGRSDIADFLGLTIETVSRTITKLKNMGLLLVPTSHSIVITDQACLKRLAENEQ
ncbi:MAG: helix-turn-helix domain-containing protein [Sneathiella sp.]